MERACQSASVAAMAWLVIACWDLAALTEGDGEGQSPGGDSGTDVSNGDGGVAPADATPPGDGNTTPVSADGSPIDSGLSWKIYSRSAIDLSQWNAQPLSAVWTGANAPPARDIRATVKLTVSDHLIVVTDDTVYVKAGTTWRAPVLLKDTMGVLVGKSFSGARHLPTSADAAATTELITFTVNPDAFIYETDGTNFDYRETRQTSDSPAPVSAPQGTKQSRWVVARVNRSQLGTVNYLNEYEAYENDGNIYFYDATPAFTNKWPFADCPLFVGTTGTPPEADIMAGWHDDSADVTYLIVR